MGLLVSQDTYDRTIRDPDDGREYRVTYRHLSGFERNRIQAMRGGSEDGGIEIDMGHMKAKAIEIAVVRWTFPFDKNWANITKLQGEVFDRLFELVSLDGKEPPEEPEDAKAPLAPSSPDTQYGEPPDESA